MSLFRLFCKKMGGQLDKRMLHWQPAKCCTFQLFIIICYLANKVLLHHTELSRIYAQCFNRPLMNININTMHPPIYPSYL